MGGGGGGDAAIEERGYVWQEGRSQDCAKRRLDFEMQNNGVNQHLFVAPTQAAALAEINEYVANKQLSRLGDQTRSSFSCLYLIF